jgi:hypothetical protein
VVEIKVDDRTDELMRCNFFDFEPLGYEEPFDAFRPGFVHVRKEGLVGWRLETQDLLRR